MSNMIQNPSFGNWQHVRYITDQEGKTGTIEEPQHWQYVYIPKESDPNKIPQSLHRDGGFVISAGYRAWEAGYKQAQLQLKAGQRYRLKARFKADVNFPGGQAPDLSAITWRFTVNSNAGKLEQEWAMTTKGQTKQVEELFYIFDSAENQIVDITFWGRSFYAGNDCDFWVYEVALEPVGTDSAIVDTLGRVQETSTSDPVKAKESEKKDTGSLRQSSGKSLADVELTNEEIDLIAAAMRTLAVNSPSSSASIGLNKLAEVLERLK